MPKFPVPFGTNSNSRTDEKIPREIKAIRTRKMETYNTERNSNRNVTRFTSNTTIETLITLSYLLETKNRNSNRPIRTIKSFRSLSKQAKKEWIYKYRNASSFNWDEEEEM